MKGSAKEPPSEDEAKVIEAKGAARETIGKLIGNDAEVHNGRAEQERAAKAARQPKQVHNPNQTKSNTQE